MSTALDNGLKQRYLANLFNVLKPIKPYLDDDQVTGIYINPDSKLWIKKFKIGRKFTGSLVDPETTRRIINFMATIENKNVISKYPVLEGVIPEYKARIQGTVEPWVESPSLCIRKPMKEALPLFSWVQEKRITEAQYDSIRNALKTRKNILVVGSTDSGKTTFLNSLIHEISSLAPDQRLYIVEDTGELICSAKDSISLCVLPHQTIDAVRSALRYDPDRIIFGELRHGDTAYEFFNIANSGHPGCLTSIHANSASFKSVFSRMKTMIRGENIDDFLNEVLDYSIFLESVPDFGPQIKEVVDLKENKSYTHNATTKLLRNQQNLLRSI